MLELSIISIEYCEGTSVHLRTIYTKFDFILEQLQTNEFDIRHYPDVCFS